MLPNIFYIDKVDKSDIKIDIDLLRKQRDFFLKHIDLCNFFLGYKEMTDEARENTEEQMNIMHGTVNLMYALLDLGEGYAIK